MTPSYRTFTRVLFSMLVLVTMLSCSLLAPLAQFGARTPTPVPSPTHPLVVLPQATRPPKPTATAAPTATSVSAKYASSPQTLHQNSLTLPSTGALTIPLFLK